MANSSNLFVYQIERPIYDATTTNSTIINTTNISCYANAKSVFLIVGYALVFTVGVLGNAIVLITFQKFWKRGPIIELLISYLALFNLLSSIIDPLMFGYWIGTCYKSWHFGWFACKVVPSLCRVFTNISIGLILIMAIDRCRVIIFPLRRRLNRGRVHWLVFAAIVIGFASEIHHINGSFINDSGLCKIVNVNTPAYLYPAIATISVRLILIVFVFFFTTLLGYLKLRNASQETLLHNNNMVTSSLNNRCRKVTIMLVIMSAVFSITVLPRDLFHLAYIISWADANGILISERLKTVNSLLKLLQTSNVVYNVFIYARMHETFKKSSRKTVLSLCHKGWIPMRVLSRGRQRPVRKNQSQHVAVTPV